MRGTKPRRPGEWSGDYNTQGRSPQARLEEWEHLRSYGYTNRHIAERLGITRDALTLALRRAKRRTHAA
jgi:hypothetical protein